MCQRLEARVAYLCFAVCTECSLVMKRAEINCGGCEWRNLLYRALVLDVVKVQAEESVQLHDRIPSAADSHDQSLSHHFTSVGIGLGILMFSPWARQLKLPVWSPTSANRLYSVQEFSASSLQRTEMNSYRSRF